MALKATVYKASLAISDMDRQVYDTHALTFACHPSETEERLMVRLITFALYANKTLAFTRGISSEDEPDIWDKDLTGHITHWIELGTPDEARIRKGCNRADHVTVVSYNPRTAKPWWDKLQNKLSRFDNLTVLFLQKETTDALAELTQRNMDLQVTVQDGEVWVNSTDKTVTFTPEVWKTDNTG
jgi:uncharacterized protein YaeQ